MDDRRRPAATSMTEPRFEPVAELGTRLFGSSRGGSLCVIHRGQIILDIHGGWADKKAGRAWTDETLGMAWSTTKGMASLAVHLLIARGRLDLDQPVGEIWPEYAVNGKEATLVRHLLAMEAGLYDLRHLIDDGHTMLDWDEMCTRLAKAAPAHAPGEACGYHAITYGWLVGELVRRVDGRSVGRFLADEVADPLGLDGFHLGTPIDELERVAPRPSMQDLGPTVARLGRVAAPFVRRLPYRADLAALAAAFTLRSGTAVMASDEFLQTEVPSVNGTFNARSLATVYANLAAPADRRVAHRLLPVEHVALLGVDRNDGRDRVLPVEPRWRLGYHQPFPRALTSPRSFGFYGMFGSGAVADPDRDLAIGLVLAEAKSPRHPMGAVIAAAIEAVDGHAAG